MCKDIPLFVYQEAENEDFTPLGLQLLVGDDTINLGAWSGTCEP